MSFNQWKAIKMLGEHVYDLKNHRHYDLLQRRNAVVDLFGYEFDAQTVAGLDDSASFRISISPDLVYISRFGFKIEVYNSSATNFQIFIEGIDLTPYFMAQWRGQFVSGNGIYPNNQLGRYDVLQACKLMDDEKKVRRILSPGYKDVRIYGDGGFTVKLYNYLKYNHVGR